MSPRWSRFAWLGLTAACALRSVGPGDRYRCLGPSDCDPFGQVCCGDGYCAVTCPAPDAGPVCEVPDASPGCPSGATEGVGCSCEEDADGGAQGTCLAGQYCLPQDLLYPGGVCSANCHQGLACPAGSQCLPIGLAQGDCLASCADDADCARPGYVCAPGLALCIPACESTGIDPGGRAADGGACEPTFSPALPDGGLLSWSANLGVSEGMDTLAEVGPTIAANGKGVVAIGWSRIGGIGPGLGLAVSGNGGRTFTPQPPLADPVNGLQGDPTLAVDATGRFTYVWTGYDVSADDPAAVVDTHVWAATSTDAVTWTPAAEVDDEDGGSGLDRPWLAIDPVTQAPWVTYRAIVDGTETIQLSIGAPGGQSFAPSVQLDDGSRPSLGRNSSQLVFDDAGSAYAAWIELGSSNPYRDEDDFDGSPLNAVRFTRLDALPDGGVGAPVVPDVLVSAAGDAVVQNQPGLAVAPDGSSLYAAYTRGTNEATDIVVTSSADRGQTWSVPVKVNDGAVICATHLHPWMRMDSQGRLWLLWFDNRDGFGHVAWSVSTDGGQSFQPNGLATDAAFSFTTTRGAPGWVGDYLQFVASGTQLLAAWADPRSLDGTAPEYDDRSHVYFASSPVPP